jgi:hypothetical protein
MFPPSCKLLSDAEGILNRFDPNRFLFFNLVYVTIYKNEMVFVKLWDMGRILTKTISFLRVSFCS